MKRPPPVPVEQPTPTHRGICRGCGREGLGTLVTLTVWHSDHIRTEHRPQGKGTGEVIPLSVHRI